MNTSKAILFSLVLLLSCNQEDENSKFRDIKVEKTLMNQKAGVACAHPSAASIGAQILKRGGNAVDAAIAVQWALSVCYPIAGNIGGGGFMVVRMSNGEVNSLDYREKAPKSASEQMYLDSFGQVIPGLSLDTHLAIGVPGTVAGLFEAHSRYGSLPMRELIKPAIGLAESGFPLQKNQTENLKKYQNEIETRNDNEIIFFANDSLRKDDIIIQPALANTLRRISEGGSKEFYSGKTADYLLDEILEGSGFITREDLESYEAIWRKPIEIDWNGFKLISMGPPSSGGIIIGQILKMVELKEEDLPDHNSVPYIHLITELERLAYADRAEHLGDPDFYDVPQEEILSQSYLIKRLGLINDSIATPSTEIQAGSSELLESMETTHLSVVDEMGNAVSVTTTLNGAYGSKIMVDSAGFFLNNEMDDFSAKPGVANLFGLVGSVANAIAPEKRMLSSMSPTIVERNGELYMVLGSPGGSTIPTSTLQVFLNAAAFDMSLDSALKQPRFHHQWLPDKLFVEDSRFADSTLSRLEAMDHKIVERGPLGLVDAILINQSEGTLEISGDPRSDNSAAGY